VHELAQSAALQNSTVSASCARLADLLFTLLFFPPVLASFADNALSYLPEGLGGLTNLKSLRAANNTLLELPDSLVDLGCLTTLDLSLNRLKEVPDRLSELTGLQQLGLFAAFSHSLRNEGSSTVRVLADMT
jgi:Leucine-rich repeat (LRR) protein